jgi:hypothetical protein
MGTEPTAVTRAHVVACEMCWMRQHEGSADEPLRPHRKGQWPIDCSGTGTVGIDLGPEEWFRRTGFGGLLLVGGDSSATSDILCRSCCRVFPIPRPSDGAFDRGARIYVTCPACRDCFPLGSLRLGGRGVWVPRGRISIDEGLEALAPTVR